MSFIEEMKTDGYELVDAHFINNERTTIQVNFAQADNELEQKAYVIEAAEEDPSYKALLEHFDIDTLHELTYKYIRRQNEAFEEEVMAIAKRRGMLFDVETVNSDLYKTLAQLIFSEFNADADKEKLFMLKLQLFELNEIKSSKNRDLKKELRKATTMLQAIGYAIDIVEEFRSQSADD